MKKNILERRYLCVLIILAVSLAVYAVLLLLDGDRHSVYVSYPDSYTYERTEILFGEDAKQTESPVAENEKIIEKDGYVRAVFRAKERGTDRVNVTVYLTGSDGNAMRQVAVSQLTVGPLHIITNNIYQHLYLALSLTVLLITVYYVYSFVREVKKRRFSYEPLFCLSVILLLSFMLALWCAASVYSFINYHTTSSDIVYTVNRNFMQFITMATLPLSAVFVLSVSVSNIELMRKEGFRPANALGLATSAVMLAGLAVIAFLNRYKNITDAAAVSILYSVLSALYVLFEALLLSTILYGIYVSRYTPAFDKDYIIILGCKIKDDGTLYPLIRGRADRAVEFYQKQLAATGKAAHFIPSGGKGSDEVLAEGEAVKNYLLSRGIPEEHITAETRSTTTKENMRFSKEIIDSRTENAKVVFSTTSYHVYRSGAIAYENGIDTDGIGSRTKWYFWPNAFLREVAGIFVNQPKKQLIIVALIALTAGAGSYLYSLF